MEEINKIINFTERKIKSTFDGLDEAKHLEDMKYLTGEDLDEAIRISIEEGNINLHSLAQCIMNHAAALDELEHRFSTLCLYVILKLKEQDLIKDNAVKGN